MKKTGLKSFAYSFFLSLFALFAADEVCNGTKTPSQEEVLIPNKNISLFLRNSPKPNAVKSDPIKRIALSVPKKEIPLPPEENDIIPLDFDNSQEFTIASIEDAAEIEIAKEQSIAPITIEENNKEPDMPIIYEAATEEVEEIITASNHIDEINDHESRENNESTIEDVIYSETNEEEVQIALNTPEENSIIPIERGTESPDSDNVNIIKESMSNQIATTSNDLTSRVIANSNESFKKLEEETKEEKKWEEMSEKDVENNTETDSNPWVVARSTKFPKNNIILDQDYFKDVSEEEVSAVLRKIEQNPDEEIKLAADIVQNILIPIPEEILKEENITPKLISSNEEKESGINDELKRQIEENEDSGEEERKSILKSITSIFSGASSSPKQVGVSKQTNKENNFFDQITKKIKAGGKETQVVKILPTEMRLSFQPNRAEISGQTLKWLHAFAKKTTEEDDVILEVRIDGSNSSPLQQKRLNLLNNILKSKGVDPNKVAIVFTEREPNSFIIRTLRVSKDTIEAKKASARQPSYYQQW